jgi:hypothetical protein
MKKGRDLYSQFKPTTYRLQIKAGEPASLEISGIKSGRPNKRITLHQKGLRIKNAKIIREAKKGAAEQELARINHLPTFEEVRLHAKSLLYPGSYRIALDYELAPPKARMLAENHRPGRDLLPCIDEPEAWGNSTLELVSKP